MKEYYFTVDGIRGKQRPRFAKGHTYTPKETVQYEKAVAKAYKEANGIMFEEWQPLEVYINVKYQIPKSYSMKKVDEIIYKGIRPMRTPDADNIAKIVLDGLQKHAFENDTQVVSLIVKKFYEKNVPSHIEVYVKELTW